MRESLMPPYWNYTSDGINIRWTSCCRSRRQERTPRCIISIDYRLRSMIFFTNSWLRTGTIARICTSTISCIYHAWRRNNRRFSVPRSSANPDPSMALRLAARLTETASAMFSKHGLYMLQLLHLRLPAWAIPLLAWYGKPLANP